jgi:broad specificity phosphatase PhoE
MKERLAPADPTTNGGRSVAKFLELRRHTDDEDDALSGEGVRHAVEIGATLEGPYASVVSTGAQRATQAAACFLAGFGQRVPGGVRVEAELRSRMEDRWRAAYKQAGSGELDALHGADPELVEHDSAVLASALDGILSGMEDGTRVLIVGHSPTNEAAVLGLTGEVVAPVPKGGGVLVVEDGGQFRVDVLDAPGDPS